MFPPEIVPFELESLQLPERGPNGERIVEMGLMVWDSTPFKTIKMSTGRWEGCKVYQASWDEVLKLHESMSKQIEFLKPLVENGTIIVNQPTKDSQ